METIKNKSKSAYHLAGIIPVAGQPLDFKMDWSDCLMPVAPNYTAIESAVYECAYAGCETIWIVCNDDTSPLIRHRVGEYVFDPVWFHRSMDKFPSESRKVIPIFYVPVHPKDRDRRDCLAWSVLHGSLTAFKIGHKISKWTAPDRYYVSFPYGIFDPRILRPHRKLISSHAPFYLRYNNKTIKDGEYLSFTFNGEDFVRFRRVIRKEGTGSWDPNSELRDGLYPTERLPIEKRWSARHFSLDKIFKDVILDKVGVVNLQWYYNIGSWKGYTEFLGSKERELFERPSKKLLGYKEFNPIGEDNDN